MKPSHALIALPVLLPLVASAQPAQDTTAKDEPASAQPEPAPPVTSVPAEPATQAEPPAQPVQPESVPPQSESMPEEDPTTEAPIGRRGFTVEASLGLSVLVEQALYSREIGKAPGVGLSLGVGYFVTPSVALSLRATDFWLPGFHVGVVGPHAQIWPAPKMWLGAGLGVGFLIGGGVDRVRGFPSFDARLGRAFRSGVNLSLEVARIGVLGPISDGYAFGEPTYLIDVMVGYQWR